MAKQTYEQYKKEQEELAKKQLKDEYKKKYFKATKKSEKAVTKALKSTGKAITKFSKAYGYKKKLSDNLLSYSNAFGGKQASTGKVGRPKGVMKWISPITNKPVPAQQYYKDVRLFNRLQKQRAEQIRLLKQQELAKKGLTPEMLQQQQIQQQQLQQQQMQQQLQQQQMQQQIQPQQLQQQIQRQIQQRIYSQSQPITQQNRINYLPNKTIIPSGTNVWKYRRGVVGQEGGLFGPVKKVYGLPESFWN